MTGSALCSGPHRRGRGARARVAAAAHEAEDGRGGAAQQGGAGADSRRDQEGLRIGNVYYLS